MTGTVKSSGSTRRRGVRSRVGAVAVALALPLSLGVVAVPSAEAHSDHGGHHGGHAADGDAVRAWNEIAVNTLIGLPGPSGGAPPASAVHVAMVQGAVFDAVNAIGSKHYKPYLLEQRFSSKASVDAAVAAAAYGVLHDILTTVPDFPAGTVPTREERLATLDMQYADALADVPDGWRETTGVAAGEAAAAAMNDDREDDGRFGPSQWVRNTAPGHWWPQTTAAGALILDPTPWVGGVDPFAVKSAAQFRTRGPNDLSSRKWAREFNEVKSLGALNSSVRTTEQTYIARWWQSNPVRSWNEVGRDLSARDGLGALATARLLALQNLSGADASITCWSEKYYWDFWRPWNAIPRAAEDGNPATEADASWLPLISAPYPDHPSGHLCLDASHTKVLKKFFGDRVDGGFSITSISTLLLPTDAKVRHFDSFSQVIDEVVEARIWAGLHYRTADLQSKKLGKGVATYVMSHELRPVGHHHHHHHHR